MDIFIHIGFQKTGSSALQVHLGLNEACLRARGVLLPHTGWDPGHGHNGFLSEDIPQRLVELGEELRSHGEAGGTAAILSFEGFCQFNDAAIQRMARAFVDYRVFLVAYVREQSQMTQTSYMQQVKGGWRHRSMHQFRSVEQHLCPHHMDFYGVISRWREGFAGNIEVITQLYERPLLREGHIVTDFLHLIGLGDIDGFRYLESRQNLSLDVPSVVLLKLLDGVSREFKGRELLVEAMLINIAENGSGAKYFLTRDEVQQVRDVYRDANAAMLREFTPRNHALAGRDELFDLSGPTWADERAPDVDIAPALTRIMEEMAQCFRWRGNKPLSAYALQNLVIEGSADWRAAGADGMWTAADRSRLRFYMPVTAINAGGGILRLRCSGHYRKGVEYSRLTLPGQEAQNVSLVDAVIDIPKDLFTPRGEMRIELEHASPGDFCLAQLEYEFT